MNSRILDFIILNLETMYILAILIYCIWDFNRELISETVNHYYQKSNLFCNKNIVPISISVYIVSGIIQIYICTQMEQILCKLESKQVLHEPLADQLHQQNIDAADPHVPQMDTTEEMF